MGFKDTLRPSRPRPDMSGSHNRRLVADAGSNALLPLKPCRQSVVGLKGVAEPAQQVNQSNDLVALQHKVLAKGQLRCVRKLARAVS